MPTAVQPAALMSNPTNRPTKKENGKRGREPFSAVKLPGKSRENNQPVRITTPTLATTEKRDPKEQPISLHARGESCQIVSPANSLGQRTFACASVSLCRLSFVIGCSQGEAPEFAC